MKKAQFKLEVEKLNEICMDTLFKKGVEYQNNNTDQDEVLANFQRGSELVEVIPEKILLIYLSKHWDSVSKFIKNIDKIGFEKAVEKSSEPIQMRLVDIINYLHLLNAMLLDRKNENNGINSMFKAFSGVDLPEEEFKRMPESTKSIVEKEDYISCVKSGIASSWEGFPTEGTPNPNPMIEPETQNLTSVWDKPCVISSKEEELSGD